MDNRKPWRIQFDQIAADNRSGATELAKSCAAALIAYAEQEQPSSVQEISFQVGQAAARLLEKHPSIAGLMRILNDILIGLGEAETPRQAIDLIRRTCNEQIAWLEQANSLLVERAAEIIPQDARILTISYSSAVAKAIVLANQMGRKLSVTCLESRPLFEGRELANMLSHEGITVSLAVDAAVFLEVEQANLVMVGADAMTDHGFVNKLGSMATAQAAAVKAVPLYVVSNTSKIWPANAPSPRIASHAPDEVWHKPPKSISVSNHYFETTPWNLVTNVVTEQGAGDPSEISQLSTSLTIHHALVGLLQP